MTVLTYMTRYRPFYPALLFLLPSLIVFDGPWDNFPTTFYQCEEKGSTDFEGCKEYDVLSKLMKCFVGSFTWTWLRTSSVKVPGR